MPIEEAVDGYHSSTDGNLTLTHTGTTEFVQLSPALKKNFFSPDLLMFLPYSLKSHTQTHTHTHTHTLTHTHRAPKTFTYFRDNNFEPKRLTTTVAGKSMSGVLDISGNFV